MGMKLSLATTEKGLSAKNPLVDSKIPLDSSLVFIYRAIPKEMGDMLRKVH